MVRVVTDGRADSSVVTTWTCTNTHLLMYLITYRKRIHQPNGKLMSLFENINSFNILRHGTNFTIIFPFVYSFVLVMEHTHF